MGRLRIQNIAASSVLTPPSGKATIFLDLADGILKAKKDTGAIVILESISENIQDILASVLVEGTGISIVYDDPGNTVTISVDESTIDHANIQNIGTNTHSQIDSHLANTSNPHATTAAQVGAYTTGQTDTEISDAITAHETALDPHPQYTTVSEASAAAPVQSVAGKVGVVTLVKADVGLSNVDNTSDINKPVSAAQGSADSAVQSFAIQRANHTGTQTSNTVSDFNEAAQDASAALLTSATHDGVSVSYNDPGNSLSIANTDKGSEAVSSHVADADPHAQYLQETDPLLVDTQILKVKSNNVGAGEYSSIEDALAAITTNSDSNRFAILVSAGTYNSNPITLKPFVSVVGESPESTKIVAINPATHLVTCVNNSYMSNLTLTGATGIGSAAVFFEDAVEDLVTLAMFLVNVKFGSNNIGIFVNSTTSSTSLYASNCRFGGSSVYNQAVVATSTSGRPTRITLRDCTTTGSTAPTPTEFGHASGAGAEVALVSCSFRISLTSPAGTGVRVSDGALARLIGTRLTGFGKAIWSENVGVAPTVRASGMELNTNTQDLQIDHPGTIGSYIGSYDPLKIYIDPAAPFFIQGKDLKIITVAKRGGDFASVQAAVDSIIDSSDTNRYVVSVGPGLFIENQINLPEYVSVKGESIQTTLIQPADETADLFVMNLGCELSFMSLTGHINSVGSGKAAIYAEDCGDFTQYHKLSIYNFDYGFRTIQNIGQENILYIEYVDLTCAVQSIYNTGSYVQAENFYTYAFGSETTSQILSEGPTAELLLHTAGMQGNDTNIAIQIQNGGIFTTSSVFYYNFNQGIYVPNMGAASILDINSVSFRDCVTEIEIDHPGTNGAINGTITREKVIINSSALIAESINFSDPTNGGVVVAGPLNIGEDFSKITDVTDLIQLSSPSGVLFGGVVSDSINPLDISISAGFGYVANSTTNKLKKVIWNTTIITLPDASNNYVYVNNSGVIVSATSTPNLTQTILLGRVRTASGAIVFKAKIPIMANNAATHLDDFLRKALGPIYVSGSIVSENGVTARHLDVSSGQYWWSTIQNNPSGGTDINFREFYHVSGVLTETSASIVNNQYYDDNTDLISLTTNYYVKHALYIAGDGTNERYALVRGQAQYPTLLSAQQGDLPSPPPFFGDVTAPIAALIMQEGVNSIVDIIDIRPRVGFQSPSTSGAALHSSLLGLTSGDAGHTQFLMLNGSTAMTADLAMGGNDVINAGSYNGVVIEAHAARHSFVGSDGFTKGTPAELTDSSNVQGTDNTAFAAGNHTHAHGNRGGGTLHAAATTSANGFMSAADKTKLDGIAGNRIIKSGTVVGAAFSGAPRTATVTFGTAFPNTNYSILIMGANSRSWSFQSKAAGSFVINSNANGALSGEVTWTCISYGESVE